MQVFLGRDLVSQADPARGRFRAFLTRSLNNFLIDEHRREHGRGSEKRPELVPRDGKDLEAAEPSTDEDPARAFDSQWARVLLEESIHRTERACKTEGLSRHWEAFESRVLRPILDGSTPPAVSALVDSLGASDSAEVSSMVHTVKRKFQRVFHQIIAETVEDESEVEDEIRAVLALLSLPA